MKRKKLIIYKNRMLRIKLIKKNILENKKKVKLKI